MINYLRTKFTKRGSVYSESFLVTPCESRAQSLGWVLATQPDSSRAEL